MIRYRHGMTSDATASGYCLVYSTAPDAAVAKQLADILVAKRRAACVSILPNVTSVYRWQGKTESATEQLLMIKTRSDQLDVLITCLQQHHPYELPEIIAVPITDGLHDYLHWIDQSVTPPS